MSDFTKMDQLFTEIGVNFVSNPVTDEVVCIAVLDARECLLVDFYFNKKTGKYESCD